MKEIQAKLILVRISARFELARVRVIGSQLYYIYKCPREVRNLDCKQRLKRTNITPQERAPLLSL